MYICKVFREETSFRDHLISVLFLRTGTVDSSGFRWVGQATFREEGEGGHLWEEYWENGTYRTEARS